MVLHISRYACWYMILAGHPSNLVQIRVHNDNYVLINSYMHSPDQSSLSQVEIILKIFSCDTVDAADTDNVLATQAGLITGWRCVRSNVRGSEI